MTQESAEVVQAQAAAVQNVAAGDKQVHRDQQETTDNPAKAEPQETLDNLEDHQFKPVNKQLHHHVTHALLDHPDHPDLQAPQETLDPTETPAKEVAHPNQDHQDPKDHQDHQDPTVTQEAQVSQEHQPNLKKQDQEHLDPPETQDHQDHQDPQDSLDSQVAQGNQDKRDQTDNQERQEMTDSLVSQETPDPLEVQEKKVSARNTAPSTVVSSSRMEHEDVKPSKKRTRGDLPNNPCPMNQQFPFLLIVAQKTAIYYVSLLYCIGDWVGWSIFGPTHSSPQFFLK